MFRGCLVATVTPMRGGAVDLATFRGHLGWLIDSGVHGLVPCGTTGEGATLSAEEHAACVAAAVEVSAGRVPVIAGAGTNSTSTTIENVRAAKRLGADAALVVTPYYNKPTQEGLYRHFRAVAEAVDLPLVLYNVPSRTGVNLLPETAARLAELPQVVGIKESSGTIQQTMEIRARAPHLCVLSGDDPMFLPHLAVGAHGLISVLANVAPRLWSELYEHFAAGRLEQAQHLFAALFPLCQALFFETNPGPVKAALGLMGRMDPELRLPLAPLSGDNLARLERVLRGCGLLEG